MVILHCSALQYKTTFLPKSRGAGLSRLLNWLHIILGIVIASWLARSLSVVIYFNDLMKYPIIHFLVSWVLFFAGLLLMWRVKEIFLWLYDKTTGWLLQTYGVCEQAQIVHIEQTIGSDHQEHLYWYYHITFVWKRPQSDTMYRRVLTYRFELYAVPSTQQTLNFGMQYQPGTEVDVIFLPSIPALFTIQGIEKKPLRWPGVLEVIQGDASSRAQGYFASLQKQQQAHWP